MRKVFGLTFALFLLCSPAQAATQQIISSVVGFDLNATTTEYSCLVGGKITDLHATEENAECVVPADGTFSDLRVALSATSDNGGGSDEYAFTVRLDNAGTALTCTVTDSDACTDLSNSFTVTAGQEIAMEVNPNNTPATVRPKWSVRWTPDYRGRTILMGGTPGSDSVLTTAQYIPIHGSGFDDPGSFDKALLAPTNGRLESMYIELSSDVPTGESITFALGTVDCTILAGARVCNSATDTQAVVAGTKYTTQMTITGDTTITTGAGWGIVFVPTVPGQFIMPLSTDGNTHSTNTEYYSLMDGDNPGNTTKEHNTVPVSTFDFINMYAELETDPGASSEIYTWTVQEETGGDLSATFTCSIDGDDSPFQCTDTETVTVSAGDLLMTEIVPTSVPASSKMLLSYTGFIDPQRRIL